MKPIGFAGRFHFDMSPDVFVRAVAQEDGRITINFITPAISQITLSGEQADWLQRTLVTALADLTKYKI